MSLSGRLYFWGVVRARVRVRVLRHGRTWKRESCRSIEIFILFATTLKNEAGLQKEKSPCRSTRSGKRRLCLARPPPPRPAPPSCGSAARTLPPTPPPLPAIWHLPAPQPFPSAVPLRHLRSPPLQAVQPDSLYILYNLTPFTYCTARRASEGGCLSASISLVPNGTPLSPGPAACLSCLTPARLRLELSSDSVVCPSCSRASTLDRYLPLCTLTDPLPTPYRPCGARLTGPRPLAWLLACCRCRDNVGGDSNSDWAAAEKRLISETFLRRVGVDAHTTSSMLEIAARREEAAAQLATSAEEALMEASEAKKQVRVYP
eukprot:1195300-Prorocentrum_minimum.AAC.3